MRPVDLLLLLPLACSVPAEQTSPEPAQVERECPGLTRVDVLPGYCVRIVPKYAGPAIAYGVSCAELTTPDPASAACAAWVTHEEERVWVNDAIVSVEVWTGSEEACSCL